jgi:hypothetical protein
LLVQQSVTFGGCLQQHRNNQEHPQHGTQAPPQGGPDPGLLGVVLVCHVGGVLGYFGVVVNTPRKLHSAGPTNRDYPT